MVIQIKASCNVFPFDLKGSTRRPNTCSSSEYQCAYGGCVPRSVVCNGFSECIDGSDEIGCGKQRNMYFIASLANTLECNNRNVL